MKKIIIDDVLSAYKETESIRETAKKTGCSWQRVIFKLYEEDSNPAGISKQIGYSEKVVRAYLPKKRPYYGVNVSENAKRIKKYRENKI